jgi:AcrR family transcriptional regulator
VLQKSSSNSDITEKAGIARQTFYRNYDDKDDVVFQYIKKSMNTDLLKIETSQDPKKKNDIVLMFNHTYMIEHRDTLKKYYLPVILKIVSCVKYRNFLFLCLHRLRINYPEKNI